MVSIGGDSTLTLVINTTNYIQYQLWASATLDWDGVTYTASGDIHVRYKSQGGCDSTVNINTNN